MTLDSEQLLRERFSRVDFPVDDSDWGDVTRRADERNRGTRLLLLAAVMLAVVAIAAPALGLTGKVVQLFETSEPAPAPVVEDFAELDVGAPKGMATGVIAEQTRKVVDIPIGEGMRAVLWVAPTRAGGFCMTTGWARAGSSARQLGGGCDRDRVLPFSVGFGAPGPISRTWRVLDGPVLYSGSVLVDDGRSVTFEFEDSERVNVQLVWVSDPIDAGFFVYSVPAEHRQEGHRPVAVTLEDRDGNVLARERAYWFPDLPTRDR